MKTELFYRKLERTACRLRSAAGAWKPAMAFAVLALYLLPLGAQEFRYGVDMVSFFDNREYGADFQKSQTLIGVRLSPEIGLEIADENGGNHRIMAGVHALQPFGATFGECQLSPTAYYSYGKDGFSMHLGAVPYVKLYEDLPSYLMYDSTALYHPNLLGGLFQYRNGRWQAEFLCDWFSQKNCERHEAFRLIGQGRYHGRLWFAGARFQMNHLASNGLQRTGACDDLVLHPYVGLDFTGHIPVDSLSFHLGWIQEYEWPRHYWDSPALPGGLMLNVEARWKFLGLSENLYVGDNLFPCYVPEGKSQRLNQGDPFYQSECYSRTDLFAYLVRTPFVSCLFSWNLHYTREYGLDHQQQLIVRFSTDGIGQKAKLRNLYNK